MLDPIVKQTLVDCVRTLTDNDLFISKLDYLRQRWLDESEYEDWKDYEAILKEFVPKGCSFIRSTKRPIGMVFMVQSVRKCIHVCGKVKGNYFTLSAKVVNA